MALLLLAGWTVRAASAALPPEHIDSFTGKPRVVVLTDIGNEPDDQMSLVRLLVYSNELDLEGLVATTSTWQKEKIQPETLHQVIAAYGEVRANLRRHAAGWPEASSLDSMVSAGQSKYGMAGIGPDQLTAGAAAIIRAVDRPDPRPLWITVWGGSNTLAQALLRVRATRTVAEVDAFIGKLRVSSIGDQDDTGPWIRREFPSLFYVVSPSTQDSVGYAQATWSGISGDVFYRNCLGADPATVTNEWLATNIRAKGLLGRHYPRFAYIMEGDTPSFLGLTDNGLESFRNPGWGGWGGRYNYLRPYGETHALWTQGGDSFARVTSQDAVTGVDGRTYISDQATIWRWREAFQHDFAARMDWTVKPYAEANHNPRVTVNGSSGTAPIYIDAVVGDTITLDAGASRDPDGNSLAYEWFHYAEAGYVPGRGMANVDVQRPNAPIARVKVTQACRSNWLDTNKSCASGVAHIILAVTDNGSPSLTSYRRVILNVRANAKKQAPVMAAKQKVTAPGDGAAVDASPQIGK